MGFATCTVKPATSARVRSSIVLYAVSATAGTRPPASAGSARTRRMSE